MAQPELTWNPDQIGAYKVIINLASEKRSYSADINDVIKVIPNRHIPNSVLNQNMIKDFEKYRQYVPFFNSPYLDEMMLWIKDNYDKVCDTSGTRLKADFVCYRGSLTTIMLAEFENQGFCIEARKLGGTIFFILNKTIVYERRDDYVLKCIYSGYKFETMGSEAKTNDRADNHPKNDFLRNEMSCVYETNFNGFNVLFAAEIDSFDKSWTAEKITKPKRARELGALEMKTSSVVATDNMYLTLRKKMVRWWAQIRLIDCDEVICGYRTREFKLHHIDHLSVKDLNHNRQQMTAHCKDSWLFLNDTLQLLREQVQNEDAFYEISYEPYSRRFKTKMVPKCDDINRYKRLICTEYEMFVNSFAKN